MQRIKQQTRRVIAVLQSHNRRLAAVIGFNNAHLQLGRVARQIFTRQCFQIIQLNAPSHHLLHGHADSDMRHVNHKYNNGFIYKWNVRHLLTVKVRKNTFRLNARHNAIAHQ